MLLIEMEFHGERAGAKHTVLSSDSKVSTHGPRSRQSWNYEILREKSAVNHVN